MISGSWLRGVVPGIDGPTLSRRSIRLDPTPPFYPHRTISRLHFAWIIRGPRSCTAISRGMPARVFRWSLSRVRRPLRFGLGRWISFGRRVGGGMSGLRMRRTREMVRGSKGLETYRSLKHLWIVFRCVHTPQTAFLDARLWDSGVILRSILPFLLPLLLHIFCSPFSLVFVSSPAPPLAPYTIYSAVYRDKVDDARWILHLK